MQQPKNVHYNSAQHPSHYVGANLDSSHVYAQSAQQPGTIIQ